MPTSTLLGPEKDTDPEWVKEVRLTRLGVRLRFCPGWYVHRYECGPWQICQTSVSFGGQRWLTHDTIGVSRVVEFDTLRQMRWYLAIRFLRFLARHAMTADIDTAFRGAMMRPRDWNPIFVIADMLEDVDGDVATRFRRVLPK